MPLRHDTFKYEWQDIFKSEPTFSSTNLHIRHKYEWRDISKSEPTFSSTNLHIRHNYEWQDIFKSEPTFSSTNLHIRHMDTRARWKTKVRHDSAARTFWISLVFTTGHIQMWTTRQIQMWAHHFDRKNPPPFLFWGFFVGWFPHQEPGGRGPTPHEEQPPKLFKFGGYSPRGIPFLQILGLEITQQRNPTWVGGFFRSI